LINTANKDFNALEKWAEYKSDPDVTYINLLSGAHTILVFKKGANVLSYADSIIPTFNSDKKIGEIWPTEKGKVKPDLFPHGWNTLL
jgi:hypothetical protein